MHQQRDGIRLDEIVARLGGELIGDGTRLIRQVATLEGAASDSISFLANPKYKSLLARSHAGAVILGPSAKDEFSGARIVCANPYAYFARVSQLLNPPQPLRSGVHPSAVIESDIPDGVSIGPGCHIGERSRIGPGCRIGAGCRIGNDTSIGEGAVFYPGVIVYQGCTIGARAILHSGAVIGADGFGFAPDSDGSWIKIPQIGRVVIGDDVEIGANTTVDRGAIDDTIIDDGVKLDNQVQIAHNVRIGAHTVIAGCVGIAGSARIGRRCMIGGAAMILGHLEICDGTTISPGTFVTKSITLPGVYSGPLPFESHRDWLKNASHVRHLDAMADRIRDLEKRLAQLEKKS